MVLFLFSVTVLSLDLKGVEIYIKKSDSLFINGAEMEVSESKDTVFIYARRIIHNALNMFGIGLEKVEVGLPPDVVILDVTAERSWIYLNASGIFIEEADISLRNGKLVFNGGNGRFKNFYINLVLSSAEFVGFGKERVKRFKLNASFSKVLIDLRGPWEKGARFDLYSVFSLIDLFLPDRAGFISSSFGLYKKGIPVIRFELRGGMNRVRR